MLTHRTGRLSLISLLALLLGACGVELPAVTPEREVVKALWDPSTATLPTPTDLVRDERSGRLALPVEESMSGAEQEWRRWLNTLDGYPTSATITIPVSGPIDEATLPGTLVLINLSTNTRVSVRARYDAGRQSILATPLDETLQPAPFAPGTRYLFGLWGYDSGLSSSAQTPVVADAGFYFVRSESSLLDHLSAMPGDSLEQKRETAQALEAVRLANQPHYQTLASYGVPRAQVATLAAFTTTSSPTYWFDPESGQIPVPNDLLMNRTDGTVELPVREEDDLEARHIKEALSHYDGFSTTGAIRVKVTQALDPAQALDPQNFRVFRMDESGELVEHQQLRRGVLDDGVTLWVKPELAFEPASDYIYVLGKQLRSAASKEFKNQPIGAMLKMTSPLTVDGEPQLDVLDAPQAQAIEPARQMTERMLTALERKGISRADISLAVPFRTLDVPKYLMGWRAKLYTQETRTDVVDVLAKTPRERGLWPLLTNVETVITGKLTTLEHLDPETLSLREDQSAQERLVDFVLTIPERARPGEPIPVVVFGHGLETSRELVYMIANKLAIHGYAAISVDLALHGGRAVCLRDTDCKGSSASCDDLHTCRERDGSLGELRSVDSPFRDGPSYPTTSGEPFINLEDIQASRDHFIQALVDLCQLVRVVRGADWEQATGGYTLDGQDVMYLGMSLGGILGSVLTVVEPTISSYLLNVPGAGLFEMVENSAAFSTLYDKSLAHRDIQRGSDDHFTFEHGIRWMLDAVDPVNVVQHTIGRPLRYTDPVDGQQKLLPTKRVMIQMARGDSVVPNITTRILSARMGVDLREYTPAISNHAFFFDPTSLEGSRAREDMIDFFAARQATP